jgi:hypothetical protein
VLGAHGAPARERCGADGSPQATEPGSGAEPGYKLIVAFVMMIGPMAVVQSGSQSKEPLLPKVDHLVYATPDLQAGVDRVEQLLWIRASPGGQHPGIGTRNALVALGPATYLEIIGPDPDQPKPFSPRTFGIDGLKTPRLVAWAAKADNLDQLVRDALQQGVKLGEVGSGSRKTPQGTLLTWRYTSPRTVVGDGIVPFFINWGQSPHPARNAASGATLVHLRAEHPDPEGVRKILGQLRLDLPVTKGPTPALVATIESPRGRAELR